MQELSITLGVAESTMIDKHGVKHARIRFSPTPTLLHKDRTVDS